MSKRLFKPLFAPFNFRCGLQAKNRIALAPLTNTQSPTSLLSEEEFTWLALRARGGFGIVTTCATHVLRSAQGWDGELGIFSDEHLPGWTRLALMGRAEYTLIVPQLFHGGFRCPSRLTGVQPVSASAFHIDVPDFEVPRALEGDEIEEIKRAFVAAAKRAMAAGLPGVEIHGANGYLFTQFLSPFSNRRTDRWGGSAENRARFLCEVVREVRAEIGPAKLLGVRISPEATKLIPDIDIDEMKDVAQELCRLGADYISISLWEALKVSDKYGVATLMPTVLEQFRKVLPIDVAVVVSGKIGTREDAERAMDHGADIVALGTAGIANPNWPQLAERSPHLIRSMPLTRAELADRGVSRRFADYLERWKFVREENSGH